MKTKSNLILVLLLTLLCHRAFADVEGLSTVTVEGLTEPTVEGLTHSSCGQSSGTTILGKDTNGTTDDALAVGHIRCSQFTTLADTCSIDEVYVYVNGNQVAGEYLTAGIYTTGGSKLVDSDSVDGDGTTGFMLATLDSSQALSSSTDYVLCVGSQGSGGFTIRSENTASGWAKSLNSESWSTGTLPTTLDFTSPTTGWQHAIYGTNP